MRPAGVIQSTNYRAQWLNRHCHRIARRVAATVACIGRRRRRRRLDPRPLWRSQACSLLPMLRLRCGSGGSNGAASRGGLGGTASAWLHHAACRALNAARGGVGQHERVACACGI